MKSKNVLKIILLIIVFLLPIIYFYSKEKDNPEPKRAVAAENKITGGSWSTSCVGSADSVHDGNITTGVTCDSYNEINFDFGGTYGSVSKIRLYTEPTDVNNQVNYCLYPSNGVGFNCALYGYPDWNYLGGAFIGPISPGWNEYNLTPYDRSKLKALTFPVFGGPFRIDELEVYYTSSAPSGTPTPSSSGTPTPSSSGTPTPSGSTIPSPSISGSDGPGPIVCANPPCAGNPDDPIFVPDENFNIILEFPNGGEKWQIGKKYKIKWHYIDKENRIKSVALFLSKDGGNNFRQVIEQNLPNNKEYEWSIPDDEAYVTDKAKVLVAAYGDSMERPLINDTSDNDFKIVSGKTEFIGITENRLPLTIAALLLFLLSSGAVLWPLTLNFLLNSFITDLLNRLPLLTAPTMGNKKSTGIVYDSQTQSAISRAVVRIFNVENSKQLESIITNKKGEFSFIVPNGSYYLTVNSTDYDFPSKRLKKTEEQEIFTPGVSDGAYSNLYFGQKILVNKEEDASQRFALNINIPLDKTKAFNLEEKMIKILRTIGNIFIKIKWPSIGLGTLLAVILVWTDFSILHLVILELYLILILYETYRLLAKNRPYGLVMDENKTAVDLAVVRFNQNNKIKSTSISGRDGKFTTAINPGSYNLSTKKVGFDEDARNISIKSTRQLEKLDIKLNKI